MALRINGYSNDEILLKLDCLIKTRQPKAESFYTTRNMTDMVRARRKIIEVTNGISKEVFIPNDNASNFRCKNCSYKRTCDQWFMEAA